MGTAVAQNTPFYSDSSKHFYAGLKRDDVKPFSGIAGIFCNSTKEFDRIDTDRDGVLSKSEIDAELKEDISNNKLTGYSFAVAGFFGAISTILLAKANPASPKKWMLGAVGSICSAVGSAYNLNKAHNLSNRLAAGVN